jgi:nicotinate-nucleotide pyrophosphorylase (carboxylating)
VKPDYISDEFLTQFIKSALHEDIGDGDHSTLACIPADTESEAKLLIKEDGILAGVELARYIFQFVDPALKITLHASDGDSIKNGDTAFIVRGATQSILSTERLVLNCMQRMSGIATKTNKLASLIKDTRVKLLDTRKTTPNFRLLEKWAVLIGGGKNHRIGLFDMIMLKDNHVDASGGIRKAILRTKEYLRANSRQLRIEIETRTLEEVEEVLDTGGVDIIMLDNMSLDEMRRAVKMINKKYETEASGGITENTIHDVAACDVDYISMGALTHSAKSLDMSLKIFHTA